MRHREAIARLPDFGAGLLNPGSASEVRRHVEGCPSCRDWLATHDLLRSGLSEGALPEEAHPDSGDLAICAIRPEELVEPGREELRAHLDRCPTCRAALALVRTAVHRAQPRTEGPPALPTSRASSLVSRRARLAAVLTFLLLGTGALIGALYLRRGAAKIPGHPEQARLAIGEVDLSSPSLELFGQELEGHRVFESEQPLLVSKLTIKSGADVTFRGRDVVAFGDGFRVAKGARLAVGTDPAVASSETPNNRSIHDDDP